MPIESTPIVTSVSSREYNSQSKVSSLQRNSSNSLASGIIETTAAASNQTVPRCVSIHVQTTPETSKFVQKDASKPVRNYSLTANKKEKVEKPTDPSFEAEHLVAIRDALAFLKIQREILAESRESAERVATERNVAADKTQFEECDQRESYSSEMTAEQDNNKKDLLNPNEREYVVPIVFSLALTLRRRKNLSKMMLLLQRMILRLIHHQMALARSKRPGQLDARALRCSHAKCLCLATTCVPSP